MPNPRDEGEYLDSDAEEEWYSDSEQEQDPEEDYISEYDWDTRSEAAEYVHDKCLEHERARCSEYELAYYRKPKNLCLVKKLAILLEDGAVHGGAKAFGSAFSSGLSADPEQFSEILQVFGGVEKLSLFAEHYERRKETKELFLTRPVMFEKTLEEY